MTNLRVVIDTNTLVSGVLIAASVTDLAVQRARSLGTLLFSVATFAELSQVIFRPKFDRYVSTDIRAEFIARLAETSEQVNIIEKITACRDPKDDQFLDVAVNGKANVLMTGDQDLLVLRSFRGVEIVSPAQFLDADR
jgi:putative PIN family toxin of toxin-antitoxin system